MTNPPPKTDMERVAEWSETHHGNGGNWSPTNPLSETNPEPATNGSETVVHVFRHDAITNEQLWERLNAIFDQNEEVLEFIETLKAAVEGMTSSGGLSGLMARTMFPEELKPTTAPKLRR